ncbi:MAG: class F sortase, partial [Patescibacteria group bacterium]
GWVWPSPYATILSPARDNIMKLSQISKFMVLLFTTVLLVGLFVFIYTGGNFNFKSVEEPQVEAAFSAFESSLEPVYGRPRKLVISSVGLSVSIEPVGVDAQGYLETPKEWDTAGWYQNSARPAEKGNLVVNAHYDDSRGNPAAFWELKNVNLDDRVTVLDSYGKSYDYKVTGYYFVDIDDPERLKVFEDSSLDIPALTLITCGGVWVPNQGTYSKRLVVSAELIK